MYVRRRLDERDLLICPKCESPQESLGSTVCEQCGADLRRPQIKRSSSPPRLVRLGHLLRTPMQLLEQGTATLLLIVSAVSFIFRTIALLALVASVIIGVLFDPDVRARIPLTRGMAAAASTWIQHAEQWSGQLMAMWGANVSPSPGTSSLTGRARRVLAATPVAAATQVAILITSAPSGAIVRLGTRQVGQTPLTLRVAPGTYRVTISRTGYATVTRTITVLQGKGAALNVRLIEAEQSPVAPVLAPKSPGDSTPGDPPEHPNPHSGD